ncbi:lipoate--protein ligase family protein [Geothermobacter hydrogeniphilus]|uniref:lipoate--protein ligase family protein n=1 Tax=Geothermobacter hydrogeniphilus TaxID=1969733 RepID=UPI00111BFCAF|nr:protein ligase [Geothermobacter hydrogeniphilus]
MLKPPALPGDTQRGFLPSTRWRIPLEKKDIIKYNRCMSVTCPDFDSTLPIVDRPWQIDCPEPIPDPAASIGYDEQLLQRVLSGDSGPVICIKHDPRCLVVTRREARFPHFEEAAEILAGEGWPLVVRCSGGSCVPQGPGILNLSLVFPKPKGWLLENGYRLLCGLFARLLEGYGLAAGIGEVPGSFCDGRYNLQVAGRKLLGTAQRWAGGSSGRSAVLAHACLLVDLDLVEATAAVNRFYRLCGQELQFDPGACATLRECLGGEASGLLMADLFTRLEMLLGEFFSSPD